MLISASRLERIFLAATAAGLTAAPALGDSAVDVAKASAPGVVAGTPSPLHVVRASGKVRPALDRFRRLLGTDRGGEPRHFPAGRRELTWDGVPDQFAAPHALPGNFFNATVAPRARGALLSTPGDHVAVSADSDNPDGAPVRFGDINPSYPRQFKAFSAERLFSPVGSNVVNLRFRVPGTGRPARVRGFGAVCTDVDRRESAAFTYYDARGRSLGTFAVPTAPQGLSFLGVIFRQAIVARVRIRYGTAKLGPNDSRRYDVAVMDNFVYGEPQPT
jgi:hypothetical protein